MINLNNIQLSEAGSEPVSLIETKRFIQVDYADDDTLIGELIVAARKEIQTKLHVALVDASVSFFMNTSKDEEELSVFPWAMSLAQVSGLVVKLIENGESDETLLLNTDYYFNGSLIIGESSKNKVSYDVVPIVPVDIKEAIKMLVAYRYNNRGDQDKQGFPDDVWSKIKDHQQIWLR